MISRVHDQPAPLPESNPALVAELRPLSELDDADFTAWEDLARQAWVPNPFQRPSFLRPLTRRLVHPEQVQVGIVRERHKHRWTAAVAFLDCAPTASRPLRHLRALTSPFTFLDHALARRDSARDSFHALFATLAAQRVWHGVRFRYQQLHCPQQSLFDEVAQQCSVEIFADPTWQRPHYRVPAADAPTLLEQCSKNRRKSLNKSRRWLESQGPVEFSLLTPSPDERAPRERFLRLESLGWKGERGSAMACRSLETQFFHDLCRCQAADGSLLFGELRCGGQVIASTCNFRHHDRLFAFKIGWHPDFANGSPGMQAEIDLARALQTGDSGINQIDSCSKADSYLSQLYPDGEPICSSVYVWSRRAYVLCSVRTSVRRFKQLNPLAPLIERRDHAPVT